MSAIPTPLRDAHLYFYDGPLDTKVLGQGLCYLPDMIRHGHRDLAWFCSDMTAKVLRVRYYDRCPGAGDLTVPRFYLPDTRPHGFPPRKCNLLHDGVVLLTYPQNLLEPWRSLALVEPDHAVMIAPMEEERAPAK